MIPTLPPIGENYPYAVRMWILTSERQLADARMPPPRAHCRKPRR